MSFSTKVNCIVHLVKEGRTNSINIYVVQNMSFCQSFTHNKQTGRAIQNHAMQCVRKEKHWKHHHLYRYAPHNDVSINDGPHIRRWSHNII